LRCLARVTVRRYRPSRMVDDPDIWCAANLLRKRYGADAAMGAAQRADALVAGSDSEDCAIWKRILADVAELARPAPPEGERVN
jgi:hypothetical protein